MNEGASAATGHSQIIGIVMPLGSQRGGAEILLQQWLSYNRLRARYSLAFLEDGSLVEHARQLGYDVEVVPTTHLRSPVNYLRSVLNVRAWIRRKRLTVVVSWMAKAHFYVAPAAALLRVKTLWYQHGVAREDDRMNNLTSALPADAIICCSETARKGQKEVSSRHALYVCYPGVDAPRTVCAADAARETLGLSPEDFIICMVARLERWKGAHVLVEAAATVLKSHPHCRFFIAGGPHPMDPAYAEELKTRIDELRLGSHVTLLGQRPPDEVRVWQASSDLIVQPSSGAEPFGIAVVEAMALQKVVLASDLGGPSEVIEDDCNGVLFPPGDAEALAAAILSLMADPERRRRIAAGAVERSRRFSMQIFADRLEEIISLVAIAR